MAAPITVELEQHEFELLTHAVRAMLSDFSHDEADIIYKPRAFARQGRRCGHFPVVPSSSS
jgi:hypothetical protein